MNDAAAPAPPIEEAGALRRFHEDENGQILPLIFAAGIIFFTGVVLVLNTGRVVNHRVVNQQAIDAAAVSGASAVARGMNYLATNNVTQAKILMSVVILRAFRPSIAKAWGVLMGHAAARAILFVTAQVLKAIPFTAAAGAALEVVSNVYGFKIWQERMVLTGYRSGNSYTTWGFPWTMGGGEFPYDVSKKPGRAPSLLYLTHQIRKVWDKYDLQQGKHKDEGAAWTILKFFSGLGRVIATTTPLIAQYHTYRVYRKNVGHDDSPVTEIRNMITSGDADAALTSLGDAGALMFPIVPVPPVCKGVFNDFVEPVKFYAGKAKKPIMTAGWIVVTISLWPLFFDKDVTNETKNLFTGGSSTTPGGGGPASTPFEEQQQKVTDISNEIEEKSDRIDHIRNVLIPPLDPNDPDDADEIADYEDEIDDLEDEIEDLQDDLEDEQEKLEEMAEEQQNQPPPGPGEPGGPNDSVDFNLPAGSDRSNQEPFKSIYPYMLVQGNALGGSFKRFKYFALGWNVAPPIEESAYFYKPGPLYTYPFPDTPVFGDLSNVGFTYAAAKVFCQTPSRFAPNNAGGFADLWAPDWKAKLVRARGADLRMWEAAQPRECKDENGAAPSGGNQNSRAGGILDTILGKVSKH